MSDKEPTEGRPSRSILIVLAGVVVIAVAIGMSVWNRRHEEQPSPPSSSAAPAASASKTAEAPAAAQPAQAAAKPAPAAAAPASQTPAPPSFDVVRIGPEGQAVIAGRAAPESKVEILDAGKQIGQVTADANGEWVYTTDKPLAPGSRELSLEEVDRDGASVPGSAPVILVVPEREAASASGAAASADKPKRGEALAVKLEPSGAVQVLQVPASAQEGASISIQVVNYDDKDHLAVAGRSTAKAEIQVYLDNALLAPATADDKGGWSIAVVQKLSEGTHTVRADQIGAGGKVLSRAEISFASGGALPKEGNVTVAWGNSLWRIARRAYGSGFDYIVIYKANKEQIRNPDLIYPGQIFKLPAKS